MEYIDRQRTSSKPGKSQKKKAGIFGKSLVLFLGALISVLLLYDRIADDDTEVVSLKPDASFSFLKQNRLLSAEQIEPGADFPSKEQQIVRWLEASQEISLLKRGRSSGGLRIALFNIPNPDTELWKSFSGGNELVILDQVLDTGSSDNITWSAFFPKDVDRDEDVQAARCPSMQLPEVRPITRPDLVVANLSCEDEGSGSRDIRYLRDSVSIGLLAASTGYESVHVLLHGTCRPVPNIFKCNELVDHESGLFQLYKLDLDRIRRLLKLPIGSCRAVMPSMVPDTKQDDKQKQAYVTIIHSVKAYVCGAIMLAHSIRRSGSTRDMVLLVDKNIKLADKRGLEAAGWKVTYTERIRNPKAKTKAYNEWNYSKFRLWQLTDYDKIIFLDSDVIVTRNMDFLFGMPELSASRNHGNVFNSGVMVVEPSLCTFKFLVDNMDKIVSYNGGDQGYLNEVFTWWHRLPLTMNFLKFFDNDVAENKRKVRLLTEEEGNNATVYAKHFLGTKPWLCHRDHDCNWYDKRYPLYANDEVHAHWWKLHDKMPPKLQGFCKMSMSRRARLDRQIARGKAVGS